MNENPGVPGFSFIPRSSTSINLSEHLPTSHMSVGEHAAGVGDVHLIDKRL